MDTIKKEVNMEKTPTLKPVQPEKKVEKVKAEVIETSKGLTKKGIEDLKNKNFPKYVEHMIENGPKIKMMIPYKGTGSGKGQVQPFTVQGVQFVYPVNEIVDLPIQFAEMVAERFGITSSELSDRYSLTKNPKLSEGL